MHVYHPWENVDRWPLICAWGITLQAPETHQHPRCNIKHYRLLDDFPSGFRMHWPISSRWKWQVPTYGMWIRENPYQYFVSSWNTQFSFISSALPSCQFPLTKACQGWTGEKICCVFHAAVFNFSYMMTNFICLPCPGINKYITAEHPQLKRKWRGGKKDCRPWQSFEETFCGQILKCFFSQVPPMRRKKAFNLSRISFCNTYKALQCVCVPPRTKK